MKVILTFAEWEAMDTDWKKGQELIRSRGIVGYPHTTYTCRCDRENRCFVYEQDERELVLQAMKQEL